jgi:hypothetical protein
MTLKTPQWEQALGYAAIDDRRIFDDLFSEGVIGLNDFKVVQRGAGANMSVDVGAGVAYVQGDDVTLQGKYRVQNDATVNVVVTAAHATLPRIDIVYLRVRDTAHGGAANDTTLIVGAGTATSGATLVNRNGAIALPNTCLWLADLLIPAASSSVTNANIGDKRVRSTSGPSAQIDPYNLLQRGATNGQMLKWSTANGRWEPSS